jgi:hypothetical protein
MEREAGADDGETDDSAVSGMPEGEPELNPMGVDPGADDEEASGTDAMPGIPKEGEPDVSG